MSEPAANPHNADLPFFETRPLGADDLAAMPARYVNSVDLPVSPSRLFEIFEDPESWPAFAYGIARVDWTSPKPFGVGTTRTVTFFGGMEVYERFFAWETGREMAFTFEGITQPVWSSFAEHYLVEDRGDEGCRLTWTVAYEPRDVFAAIHFMVRPMMVMTFKWYMRRLRGYCRRAPRMIASTP